MKVLLSPPCSCGCTTGDCEYIPKSHGKQRVVWCSLCGDVCSSTHVSYTEYYCHRCAMYTPDKPWNGCASSDCLTNIFNNKAPTRFREIKELQ